MQKERRKSTNCADFSESAVTLRKLHYSSVIYGFPRSGPAVGGTNVILNGAGIGQLIDDSPDSSGLQIQTYCKFGTSIIAATILSAS